MFQSEEEKRVYVSRAEKIADRMSLEEKVDLMGGKAARNKIHGALKGTLKEHYNEHPYEAGGNEKYGIPPVRFCDGPRGVVCGRGKSTCFPSPVMRAASFDPELEEEIGKAVGEEAESFGADFFGGICINVPYHPGWGRSQETYGEDTYLIGRMGAAMVQGVESTGVIACVKHFAFNSMENERFEVNVDCSKKTEREIFLRQFEMCVRAGAGGVMSAYNKYKGVMCGHSRYLLTEVLRREWKFDGIIMSDFTWGIRDTVRAANAGENIEMADTRFFGDRLVKAVKEGGVPEAAVRDAAVRIISTSLYFEDIRKKKSSRIISWKKHRDLALRSAEEGITLLKNEDGVLPLDKKTTKKIAVFGRLAEMENTGDRGSARVYPPYTVSPLEGLVNETGNDTEVIYYRGRSIHHAKRLAAECDAVLIFAGYDYRDEGEAISKDAESMETGATAGGDRMHGLRLHESEEEMLEELGGINPRTVAVLIGGSTIIPGKWLRKIPALIFAYYAGMEGGNALARVLFGDAEPGGRLPFVIPEDEADLPFLDFHATEVRYDYWYGYRKLLHDGKRPMFPFGFGLSYTEFELGEVGIHLTGSGIHLTGSGIHKDDMKSGCGSDDKNSTGNTGRFLYDHQSVTVSVQVKNTGTRAGGTVVQVYVKTPEKDAVRTLRGFQRVRLDSGKCAEAEVEIPLEDLKIFDEEKDSFVLREGRYEVSAGFSSAEKDLKVTEMVL